MKMGKKREKKKTEKKKHTCHSGCILCFSHSVFQSNLNLFEGREKGDLNKFFRTSQI